MSALLNSSVPRQDSILQHRLGRMLFFCCMVSVALYAQIVSAGPCDPAANERKVSVRDYHAVGDGKTDDGPAIRAALKAVIDGSKPASLEFEQGKTYRIASFDDTYALRLLNTQKVTLHGNGAELLLLPPNKVLHLSESSDVNVCGLTIDYFPLPFTQGMVVSTNPKNGTFDIQIEEGFDIPEVDTATVHDNSKVWEFGMPYKQAGKFEKRVNIKSVHAAPGKRRIRITPTEDSPTHSNGLIPNETHFVMTIPGKGQKGNFAFQLLNNERIYVEGLRVYSVPQYTFYIANNQGAIKFVDIEERPRPGTSRAMAGWRDVFHVKDNRTPIQWDGCYIEGAFDDAFNLSAMYQLVVERTKPKKWKLRDLGKDGAPIYKMGDRLQVIDLSPERKLIGETTIISVDQKGSDSIITVSDDLPVKAGKESCNGGEKEMCGSRVVNLDAANSGSLIRNCTINGSVRIRSKATIARSKIDGVLQIASTPTKEGPSPKDVLIKDSELIGNVRIGSDVNTKQNWSNGERWAQNIVFQSNKIEAVFRAEGASLGLFGNEINWPKERKFELKNCGPVQVRNLRANGAQISNPLNRFSIGQNMTIEGVELRK